MAHCPAAGVKVKICVPGVAVLIVDGLHVPGTGGVLVDVAGSVGAGDPSQIEAIGLKAGVTVGSAKSWKVTGSAHEIGVNV